MYMPNGVSYFGKDQSFVEHQLVAVAGIEPAKALYVEHL